MGNRAPQLRTQGRRFGGSDGLPSNAANYFLGELGWLGRWHLLRCLWGVGDSRTSKSLGPSCCDPSNAWTFWHWWSFWILGTEGPPRAAHARNPSTVDTSVVFAWIIGGQGIALSVLRRRRWGRRKSAEDPKWRALFKPQIDDAQSGHYEMSLSVQCMSDYKFAALQHGICGSTACQLVPKSTVLKSTALKSTVLQWIHCAVQEPTPKFQMFCETVDDKNERLE